MTMTEAQASTVEYLLRLGSADFENIVNNEMRSTSDKPRVSPEIAAGLRDRRVLRRWYTAISSMHKSVEGQFAAKTADNTAMIKRLQATNAPRAKILKEQSSFETWRAGALRVKNGLEIRLIEAKALLEESGDPYLFRAAQERDASLGREAILRDAIRRHMMARLKIGASSDDVDEALWSYLPADED